MLEPGIAEEARTRGFAAPAFAGCAFVERLATLSYRVVQGLSSNKLSPYPIILHGFRGECVRGEWGGGVI
jgi:hypothetical protein